MDDGPFDPETGKLIPRDPTLQDLVALCRELQSQQTSFIVVGGFAIRTCGLNRTTGDIDLLIDASEENERRVFDALATLPDGCVRELDPGDVAKYTVVRVADEILVDPGYSAKNGLCRSSSPTVVRGPWPGQSTVPGGRVRISERMVESASG